MKCPHCNDDYKSSVKETRLHGDDIARRRECSACGQLFVTRETVDSTVRIAAQPGAPTRCRKTPVSKPNRALEGVWK